MCEAHCNIDYRMLRAKLVVGRKRQFRQKCAGVYRHRRWNVAGLQGEEVDNKGRETANLL
jgi:hypothetical protein